MEPKKKILSEFLSRRYLILPLFIYFFGSQQVVYSQLPLSPFFPEIDSILDDRGEAYIAIPLSKYKNAVEMSRHFSFDGVKNDTAFYYITAGDTSSLYQTGIKFITITPPSLKAKVSMAQNIMEVLEGKAYPTYGQYLEIMERFQNNYPGIITIDTIGYSINNRLILAARITTPNNTPAPEQRPVVFLSSTMHGDEPPGYVILLMLMDELMERYSSDTDITELLNQLVLIINPLANPDGTYFVSDNTVYGSTRNNLNNIDLNRNFPDPHAGPFPYGQARQPENQVMMDYMSTYPPSLSANIHTGAEVVNYPWDWRANPNPADKTPNPHPDDAWFHFISKEYADTAREGHSAYMSSFTDGITNGAAWYVIYGGRQDYVTAFLRGRELTLEISNEKIPSASQLSFLYERNSRSLINFIKQAQFGIQGTVSDQKTGLPIRASLRLEDHDTGLSYIFSDSLSGIFRRYLKSGTYTMAVEKEGYKTSLVNLNISDYQKKLIDIQLIPDDKHLPAKEILCYPNPFTGIFKAMFYLENPDEITAELFSIEGIHMKTIHYNAPEGYHTIEFDNLSAGTYILRITGTSWKVVKKVIGL